MGEIVLNCLMGLVLGGVIGISLGTLILLMIVHGISSIISFILRFFRREKKWIDLVSLALSSGVPVEYWYTHEGSLKVVILQTCHIFEGPYARKVVRMIKEQNELRETRKILDHLLSD